MMICDTCGGISDIEIEAVLIHGICVECEKSETTKHAMSGMMVA